MITVEERFSVKLAEITSIFVRLNFFDKRIFDFLVQIQNSVYDKSKNEFEIGIDKLYFVIDYLTNFCDVKFLPLPEWFISL